MNKFKRGSEWRKWDLHVHTPQTKLNNKYNANNGQDIWDFFCEKIEQSDVVVFGVTDYFSVSNFIFFEDEFYKKYPESEKVFFPNIEFRLDSKNSKSDHIQLHVIFNNENNILSEVDGFLTRLPLVSTNDQNSTIKYCSDKDLNSVGFDKAMVKFGELTKALKKDFSEDDYLIVGVANGYGSLRPESGDGRGSEFAKELDKVSDLFFGTSSNTDFYLNIEEGRKQYNLPPKPVLSGSDAHSFEDLNNKLGKEYEQASDHSEVTWIKADPTFEGLKQIIYEPENRVYIGEEPPIISRVANNKTNYLKSLEINPVDSNHTGDTWFEDISIPFSKELVAIIGNKGSGKSGIADILGLVGDTHTDKQHFSFLHKDKFLKGRLADKFKARIFWESTGESEEVILSDPLKTENPESVRFIPQNYFEELTNELEISKFQNVLENIIFEYIPDSEKLDKSSFEDLERYKTENVNTAIQEQKNKIQNINKEIIDLEKKKHPDYLKSIKGLISKKQIEINEQNKLLQELPEITDPNDSNEGLEQQSDNITKHNRELDLLRVALKEKERCKSDLTSKLEAVKQFKEKIELQQQSLIDFLQRDAEEAKEYNLNINDILKITVDYSSVNKKITEYEAELEGINIFVESVDSIQARSAESNNKSIVYRINLLTNKLKSETDKLTGEEKKYQQNEQRKKSINEKIQELTGDPENPSFESLKFHQKEKEFITADLTLLLEKMRANRIEKSLEVFKKKNEINKLYDSFKQSVDDKIAQNEDLLEDYDIKIDSSFNLNSSFYSDFLAHINQRKRGCFLGAENGENKIKLIVEENGFSDENKIKDLLQNIISSLEENNVEINEQVNDDKLHSFYDYVFSLDYLNPKYELKLSGKVLGQLSPGERGALLLIFYLMIDKEEIPLVIDQPEDNLDNESVYNMLSKFIKHAKKKRQIIMVTHNPNLAVGADAEQIIYVSIDKTHKNKFSFVSGSIENPEINQKIVQILEGTQPAFDKRKLKYQRQ